jgi:prephenate dehydrogenase
MNVGIVGLGLIGGSMAKAFKKDGRHRVLACDTDRSALNYAFLAKAVDEELTDETLKECDLLLLAVYPKAAIAYLTDKSPLLSKTCLVIDLCGIKKEVCCAGFSLSEQYGFCFVGGHPMAGTQYSGFKYARADLFKGAPMVIVPPTNSDIYLLSRVKEALTPAGFGKLSVTTAEKHDEMIAFTSQLAHIVSNAYIKSPTASVHKGFSAGSYKDLTRVAWLNEDMWTELFLENRENLIRELHYIIQSLSQYEEAIAQNDADTLRRLLREGKERKKEIDG